MLGVSEMFVVCGLIGRRHYGGVPRVIPYEGFETLISPTDAQFVRETVISMASYLADRVFVRSNLCAHRIAEITNFAMHGVNGIARRYLSCRQSTTQNK